MNQPVVWRRFCNGDGCVNAVLIQEDFIYETTEGWKTGKAQQWLIEVAPGLRFHCSDETFYSIYEEYKRELARD